MVKKKLIAEFTGTFALVFCGTGAIVINDVTNGVVSHLGIAIVFGAIVAAMIYTFGSVSGAHINPAVTMAFWLSGNFKGQLVIPYVASQFCGGILASLIVLFLFPDHTGLGATLPANGAMQSFVLEIILSFFLMLVIFQVAFASKEISALAGIIIGVVVMLEAAFAGPITGASMNPARSLGPALVSGNLQNIWLYLTAPVIGMMLSIVTWKSTKENETDH